MLRELTDLEIQFEALACELANPDIFKDLDRYAKTAKEYSDLEKLLVKHQELSSLEIELDAAYGALNNLQDPAMISFFTDEIQIIKEKIEKVAAELKSLTEPKTASNNNNVLLEVRAGAGGQEAALFADEILAMYIRYAEKQKWSVTLIDDAETELGGSKNATILIEGENTYSKLKNEAGVHRVQRVPQTESSGRVHSSTITVAILEEAGNIEFEINMNDIKIDTFCSSTKAGGQSLNTTYSAVRLTHLPTGIVASCQDERSQLMNKKCALKVLEIRLVEKQNQIKHQECADIRRQQVGTANRNEKIRTYNFKENRVTDHRINYTTHQLDSFMDGQIDDLVEQLSVL